MKRSLFLLFLLGNSPLLALDSKDGYRLPTRDPLEDILTAPNEFELAQDLQVGSYAELREAYDKFYASSEYAPIAMGTFLKSATVKVDGNLQASLLKNAYKYAQAQGRPLIIDTASIYNKFMGAGVGVSSLVKEFQNSSPIYILMKFNEADFDPEFPSDRMGKDTLDAIKKDKFKERYKANLKEMGVDHFTVVMPHGNFLKDYTLFIEALEELAQEGIVDKTKTGLGASNFLRLESLNQALAASQKYRWSFVMIEYEKHLRADLAGPRQFLEANPDIFASYIGVFGGKSQKPPFDLKRRGTEDGRSVPEIAEGLMKMIDYNFTDFTQFANPMELAVNAAIRKHKRSIVVLGSSSPEHQASNFQLRRHSFSDFAEGMLTIIEGTLALRYGKGVRTEDRAFYDLEPMEE